MPTIQQRLDQLEQAHGDPDERYPVPQFRSAAERQRYLADFEYQVGYARSHGFQADRFFQTPEQQARFLARRRCILRRVHAEKRGEL